MMNRNFLLEKYKLASKDKIHFRHITILILMYEGGILIFTVSFATVFLPDENNVKRYDQHMIMLTLFDKH